MGQPSAGAACWRELSPARRSWVPSRHQGQHDGRPCDLSGPQLSHPCSPRTSLSRWGPRLFCSRHPAEHGGRGRGGEGRDQCQTAADEIRTRTPLSSAQPERGGRKRRRNVRRRRWRGEKSAPGAGRRGKRSEWQNPLQTSLLAVAPRAGSPK